MTIQHSDRNISPAEYNHLKSDEILITKVFLTLQSEGPLTGTVAVFIRLAGCNRGVKARQCEFCDTHFAFDKGTTYTVENLLKEVREKFAEQYHSGFKPLPLVVITGGEPMIQKNVVNLINELIRNNYRVQIESNGDRLAEGFKESSLCDNSMLVVSPKVIPSSQKYRRLVQPVFERADALKFVVEEDPKSPYHELPEYLYDWTMYKRSTNKIYISPITVYRRPVKEGEVASVWTKGLIDKKLTAKNYSYAASLCIRYGYSLSCQTHTFLAVE